MPYEWIPPTKDAPETRLHLWPHRSLPKRGFVWTIGGAFAAALIPLIGFLGTAHLWWLLAPFLIALSGLYFLLGKSYRDAEIFEEMVLTETRITLTRHGPRARLQTWQANPHWTRISRHETGGPVPEYVTLKGEGREVEIGAFLSEDERKRLFYELKSVLAQHQ